MRIRGSIDYFGAVQGQRPSIFGIGAFISHHDPEAANLGVSNRPEGIEIAPVFLHPPVVDVMGTNRVLNRKQR
jgi:hypothetical protein